MDDEKQSIVIGFKSRRRKLYRQIRRWASAQRSCEWFFILFRARYVTRKTELVIEGYPRCGNSFARWAFILAQDNPVIVADHFHSIGHVKRALRLRTPILILIRNPLDAICSFLVLQKGNYSVRYAIREYIEFYTFVFENRSKLIVANFEDVISDFGEVIERVNVHYGTSFKRFVHTEENVNCCFQILEERNQKNSLGEFGRVDSVSRPVEARGALKDRMKIIIESVSFRDLLCVANDVYQKIMESNDVEVV